MYVNNKHTIKIKIMFIKINSYQQTNKKKKKKKIQRKYGIEIKQKYNYS